MSAELGWVDDHFLDFYSGLDTGGIPPSTSADALPTDGTESAVAPAQLLSLASELESNLRGKEGEPLREAVRSSLRTTPEYFLVFAHLYRQKKFTAAELAHFFFEDERTNEVAYFRQLELLDGGFRKLVARAKRTNWLREQVIEKNPRADLAVYKKAITGYLGSERASWPAWRSRIMNDPGTVARVAAYLVDREHLAEAVSSGAFVELVKHTMRASSSEETKLDIGDWNASRVEGELKAAGFGKPPCGHIKHGELRELADCSRRIQAGTWFEREVRSDEFDRQFDFALTDKGGVRYVIETNYYTSAGSKIDKTVKDFKTLEPRVRGSHPLIYITDGVGWLGLVALIRVLIEVNRTREAIGVPFYFNLRQFRSYLPQLKRKLES